MSGKERREYRRTAVAYPLRLAIEIGVDGATPAIGRSVNISRGGMLAVVGQRVSLAARCKITFFGDAAGRVEPAETRGTVRRVVIREHDFLVGIEFDQPLTRLDVENTLWKKKRIFGMWRRR